MKKLLSLTLAILLLLSVAVLPAFAEANSPAEFGWETDEVDGIKDYTGWTTEDGVTITASVAGATEDNRIWKPLLTDQNNFSVTIDYNASNTASGYMKALGVSIELDGRHGNGNQVYLKVDGSGRDWISCNQCDLKVTFNRKAGGTLDVILEGGPTLNLTPKEDNENFELGLYAGTVVFGNITVGAPINVEDIPKTPADYGWQTDSGATFAGWTAAGETDLSAVFSETDGEHRIWKSFIEDEDDYACSLTMTVAENSSGYVKIQKNIVELDARGGEGNQFNLKINSEELGWVKATGNSADISFQRKGGGEIELVVRGKDGDTRTANLRQLESNTNMELGLYAGSVTFSNISFDASGVIVPGEKTPGDFGWETDADATYAGWTAQNEVNLTGVYAETDGEHRLWKNLLGGKDRNFLLTVTVTVSEASSGYVKLFDNKVELDARDGDGSQLYVKFNDADEGAWIAAPGRVIPVTMTRKNGGNLTVAVGELSQTFSVTDETHNNVEIGLYAGTVNFSGFSVKDPEQTPPTPTDKTPGDFGWLTDNDDFAGWAATSASDFTADYSKTVNDHRIWKELTESWNNCYISLTYTGTVTSAAYFKIMGNRVELNCRDGNGNQIYLKVNEGSGDWFDAKGCKAEIMFRRGAKGNITVTVTGAGSDKVIKLELTPSEMNPNFEIGVYAGYNVFNGVVGGTRTADFTDVPAGAWYYDVVYEAVAKGLFNGTSETTFDPMGEMTRAMLVQVLYNLEGAPDVSGLENPFSDVPESWYTKAVLWAASKNIVAGADGKFSPDGKITREQIAAILYRYAGYKGADVSGAADLSGFSDANTVSNWALTSIRWAVEVGFISGKQNGGVVSLAPLSPASRAEVASMMVRFLKILPEE